MSKKKNTRKATNRKKPEPPEPVPVMSINVTHSIDPPKVLVEVGGLKLALAPEAAHALSAALTQHANEIMPLRAGTPSPATPASLADPAAILLIDTFAILIERYKTGKLAVESDVTAPPKSG